MLQSSILHRCLPIVAFSLLVLLIPRGAAVRAQGSCVSVRVAEAQRLLRATEQKVMVEGRVTGFDGTPARKAHVHFRRRAWGPAMPYSYTVDATGDGSYRMKLPEGLYDVSFTGVDHQKTRPYRAFFEKGRDNRIDGRLPLSPFFTVEQLDTVMIMYTDLRTRRDIEERMRRVGPGVYEYEAPVSPLQGEVRYHLWGIMPGRRVNGTQGDFFHYDNGGDYQSVIRLSPGDSVLRVRFDHSLLPAACPGHPEALRDSAWGAPLDHPVARTLSRIAAVQAEMHRLQEAGLLGFTEPDAKTVLAKSARRFTGYRTLDSADAARVDSVVSIRIAIDMTGDTLAVDTLVLRRSDEHERLIARMRAQADSCLAQSNTTDGQLCYLPFLEAQNTTSLFISRHMDAMRDAFRAIPPSSRAWTLSRAFTLSAHVDGMDSLDYLLCMTREQENEQVVVEAYKELFSVLEWRIGTSESSSAAGKAWRELSDSLYTAVKDCFGATEHLTNFIYQVEGPKAYYRHLVEEAKALADVAEERMSFIPPDTLAGRPLHDFRYPVFGASGHEFTRESMLGKTYLLAITTPGSMPEDYLGMLDEAMRMYGDRGLVGVFVIRTPDTRRIPRYMDFLASCGIMEGRNIGYILLPADELEADRYSARLADEYYLVDSKGIIRASGDRLFGEFIFPTLARYFAEDRR
jgi:hypothetical protein